MIQGDITLQQNQGRAIVETIKKFQLRYNLEIGSKCGNGSTSCFLEGMKYLSGDKRLDCIEPNKEFFDVLKEGMKGYPFVVPHRVSSISWKNFHCKDFDRDVWNNVDGDPIKCYSYDLVKSWYASTISFVQACEKGFLEDDKRYDSVLIDGSGFCGYSEYLLLKDRVRCFFLDDVHRRSIKTNKAYSELKANNQWDCLYDDSRERNGWAVFLKK
jgi:hypothetical protein